jgi:hypothetical protein
LRELDAVAYPAITVGVRLTTGSSSETPQIDSLIVGYIESMTPLASRPIIFTSTKSIGTRADTSVVYKNVISTTTSALGNIQLNTIEADAYSVVASGYDVAEVCEPKGLTIAPGSTINLELLFTANTANTIRVVVSTPGGTPVIGALVELELGAFSETKLTGSCGQVFFGSLTADPAYTLDVSATGYTTQNLTDVDISGDKVQNISL